MGTFVIFYNKIYHHKFGNYWKCLKINHNGIKIFKRMYVNDYYIVSYYLCKIKYFPLPPASKINCIVKLAYF